MRLFLAVLAIGGLPALLSIPRFAAAPGFPAPVAYLLVAVAVAVLVVTLAWPTTWRRAAGWFAVVLVGQSLSLQLIDAGPTIHYQHYRPAQGSADADVADLLLLAGLAVQAIVVALCSRLRLAAVWLRNHFGAGPILIAFVAVVAVSAFPSHDLVFYGAELLLAGAFSIVQLATLWLGLLSVPRSTLAAWGAWLDRHLVNPSYPGETARWRVDRLALVCAVWIFGIAVLLSVFAYERHPHVPDEVSYIYNANYFAAGRLSAPAPPVPEAVEVYLVDCNDERCISPVPPGWPVLLAIGSFFDLPWLVNPVLGSINVVLIFLLLLRLYDRCIARIGVLLVSASPWYLFMAMNFMTHMASLTWALLATLSVVEMRRTRSSLPGIPGGLAIGCVSLTRPLEGLMVATVLGLVALGIKGRYVRLAPVAVLGLSAFATGALVLPYNQATTGDPLVFPIMAYTDKVLGPGANALGFGPDKGIHWGGLDPFPGHGLPDVIVNAVLNLVAMNIELFGWSIGSLLPIILLLLRPWRQLTSVDRWLVFFIAVVFAYQSLYWFSGGPDFGARYYFLVIVPLVALTAQALRYIGQSVAGNGFSAAEASATVFTGVLVVCVAAIINFVPWRAIDKYHHYRGMRPDIRTIVSETTSGSTLLLINGEVHPDMNSALVYSALDPYGDQAVIAWDRSPEVRRRLLDAYPDREVWLIDGPSRTGASYRIVAGPLDPRELAE